MSRIDFRADHGAARVFVRLHGVRESSRRAIRHAWFDLGKDLRSEANREILHGVKSGRLYRIRARGGRFRLHRASAPGQTHANLTGALRRSIGWKVHGHDSMDFGYGVATRGPEPRYAPFVEFGTFRMAPRPSLMNAISATQGDAERAFQENLRREFTD